MFANIDPHLRSWFEQEPPAPEALSDPAHPLMLMMAGGEACAQAFDRALEAQQWDRAAACVLAAIAAIWDGGRDFPLFAAWQARAQALMAGAHLHPLAHAALAVQDLTCDLLGAANLRRISQRIPQVQALVEAAHSDALRIMLAAVQIHQLVMCGELNAADIQVREAVHYAPGEHRALVPKLGLAIAASLLDVVRGNISRGQAALEKILSHPGFSLLPPGLSLLASTHYLQCLAFGGDAAKLEDETERLRAVVVPGNRAYHRSYVHFSLAVAELVHGQPSRALTHALLSAEQGRLCHSSAAQLMPSLVQGQALADLGRDDDAIDHFSRLLPEWTSHGFMLVAAAGWLELANLHLRHGRHAAAEQALNAARHATPVGETLPNYHRPAGYAQSVVIRLSDASTHEGDDTRQIRQIPTATVQIRTFGALHVEVGGRTIYDRDWRGTRTKTLLKALIVLGGHKVPAHRLSDLLWPDADGDNAGRNLKVALSRLRHLGRSTEQTDEPNPWLVMRHGHVSLLTGCAAVDAIEFMRTPANDTTGTSELLHALELYAGDFLASDDSEPWITEHRDRLRRHYVALTCTLAKRTIDGASSAPPADLTRRHLERAAELSPLDERCHELLMHLHLRAGHPALALAVYDHAANTLQSRLGVAPGQALQALRQQTLDQHTLIKRNES